MGMFDYVNVEAPCPACAEMIGPGHWQSKDADCTLELVSQADVNGFCAICPHCKVFVEYERNRPRVQAYTGRPEPLSPDFVAKLPQPARGPEQP